MQLVEYLYFWHQDEDKPPLLDVISLDKWGVVIQDPDRGAAYRYYETFDCPLWEVARILGIQVGEARLSLQASPVRYLPGNLLHITWQANNLMYAAVSFPYDGYVLLSKYPVARTSSAPLPGMAMAAIM